MLLESILKPIDRWRIKAFLLRGRSCSCAAPTPAQSSSSFVIMIMIVQCWNFYTTSTTNSIIDAAESMRPYVHWCANASVVVWAGVFPSLPNGTCGVWWDDMAEEVILIRCGWVVGAGKRDETGWGWVHVWWLWLRWWKNGWRGGAWEQSCWVDWSELHRWIC